MRLLLLTSSVAVLSLTACSDDPVRYSEPVSINLKAKSSDVINAVVTDEKNINTESGNPYGAFINEAKAALGGADPGGIELDHTEIFLGAASTGVTRLGEIFTGDVEVIFVLDDTTNSVPAARVPIAATDGGGPIGADSTFTSGALSSADYAKLLSGGFKVVVRGPAAVEFTTKGADADLQITMTFTAFE